MKVGTPPLAEEAEVLGPHRRVDLHDVRVPERPAQDGHDPVDEAGRVDRRRRAFADLDARARGPGGPGPGRDPALDPLDQLVADLGSEGAEGELEPDLVGDDVVLGPAVDRADGDDRRVERVDLAADDRLEVEHRQGGQDDRVDRPVRRRPVAPLPRTMTRPRSSRPSRGRTCRRPCRSAGRAATCRARA